MITNKYYNKKISNLTAQIEPVQDKKA